MKQKHVYSFCIIDHVTNILNQSAKGVTVTPLADWLSRSRNASRTMHGIKRPRLGGYLSIPDS